MEVYTVDIRSWTASFRYPNLISGVQPTLEVPPISTVLGLINAAAGTYQSYERLELGYYFEYQMKAVDLETIYMLDTGRKPKSNVIQREFLFNAFLRLYLKDEKLANYFQKPYYPLVLGRMNDLANVDINSIQKVSLIQTQQAEKIRGQIIPFKNKLPGVIQALPKYFTNTIPRQNLGTEPFSIINHLRPVRSKLMAFRDNSIPKEVDIYFHEIVFND